MTLKASVKFKKLDFELLTDSFLTLKKFYSGPIHSRYKSPELWTLFPNDEFPSSRLHESTLKLSCDLRTLDRSEKESSGFYDGFDLFYFDCTKRRLRVMIPFVCLAGLNSAGKESFQEFDSQPRTGRQ